MTEFTVTDPAELRSAIAAARRQGYAAIADEIGYGILAVASSPP